LWRQIGDTLRIGETLASLAGTLRVQGALSQAAASLREAMDVFRANEAKWQIAACLEEFGRLAWLGHQPERAARCFGAAATLREQLAAPVPPADLAEQQATVAALRTTLGDAAFAAAWEAGCADPLAPELSQSGKPMPDREDSAAIRPI
jgi:hypothetical protein